MVDADTRNFSWQAASIWRHFFKLRNLVRCDVPVVLSAGIENHLRFVPALIVEAPHEYGDQVGACTVTAGQAAAAGRAKRSRHLGTAVGDDCEFPGSAVDHHIGLGEIGIGSMACAGELLTIEAMALHHHLRTVMSAFLLRPPTPARPARNAEPRPAQSRPPVSFLVQITGPFLPMRLSWSRRLPRLSRDRWRENGSSSVPPDSHPGHHRERWPRRWRRSQR